jgi:hypothetical protein
MKMRQFSEFIAEPAATLEPSQRTQKNDTKHHLSQILPSFLVVADGSSPKAGGVCIDAQWCIWDITTRRIPRCAAPEQPFSQKGCHRSD